MEGSGERQVYAEDEINLFDYFQVIWKRRILIISIFLAAVTGAAAISFMMKPVYRVSALISPGWIDVSLDGRVTYIDSNENIQFSIENGAFDSKIIETLKLDSAKYNRFNFKTKLSKGSNVIQVYLDTTDREKGKLILGELLNNLTSFYKNRIDLKFEGIKMSAYIMRNQIATLDNKKSRVLNDKKRIMSDMGHQRDRLVLLKNTEKNLQEQIKGVQENTKAIMKERENVLKEGKADSIALLLYSNTIQQNISYIDRLNSDIEKNMLDQEATKNELSKKEIQLKDKDTETKDLETEVLTALKNIEKLELDKMKIEGIKILHEPSSTNGHIKPKKAQNIAIAGVTSLFGGIFLAFFIEFISKGRARNTGQPG